MAAHQASITATLNRSKEAPYTLHTLLRDVPLKEDPDSDEDVYITAVDVWEGNLYIGTSAAELLHFVSFQAEDPSEAPQWILASRQKIDFNSEQEGADKGIKQILILPGSGKACIVCNATLTFYTLPELSPAFGGRIRQAGCTWIGGLDLSQTESSTEPVAIIYLRQRLRLIKIGEEARKIRDIELGNVRALQRRGDLACVADGTNYSLLDVVNQRQNELFPISSSQISSAPAVQNLAPVAPQHQHSRSISSTTSTRFERGHARNPSLNALAGGEGRTPPSPSPAWPARGSSHHGRSPSGSIRRESVSSQDVSRSATPPPPPKDTQSVTLPPNIASPSATEFLLATGTKYTEPGVGLFVNLDGDVVRGTIEFSSYPDSMVLDGGQSNAGPAIEGAELYVLALVRQQVDDHWTSAVEIQRIDDDIAAARHPKSLVALHTSKSLSAPDAPLYGSGLRLTTTTAQLGANNVGSTLRQRRLHLSQDDVEPDEAEKRRNEEEDKFADRFSSMSSNVLVFAANELSWMVRSSPVVLLNSELERAVSTAESRIAIDTARVQFVLNSVRGQEATSELAFVTLSYVRQRGALLLFAELAQRAIEGRSITDSDGKQTIAALEESDLDARVLLTLLPSLRSDVVEGKQGIWLSQGLVDTHKAVRGSFAQGLGNVTDWPSSGDIAVLRVLKAYLTTWRKKKGFGSVADEALVFSSVDAALIHVLLLLDKDTPRGPAIAGSIRAELNEIVDKGIDCFDRASELFKQFNRIYMLSRLYQSRKMSAQVLACWRRIIEGQYDAGGELIEGEIDLRRYLTRLRDKDLVVEYGSWLANRDPKLGVQVFADETAKTRFEPKEAVSILQSQAPRAVKDYLEYLVFAKHHVQYINELITFYLSTILDVLTDKDNAATSLLQQTTETYRALKPPKPTFSDFLSDNAIDAEWWANRLRLLQLIGGSHGASSQYDVHALRTQLAPHSDVLVPEMIILNGREGKHKEAVHLLVSGLGDYDTAVRYCLLGGRSIFHPPSATAAERPPLPSQEEQGQLFRYLLHEFLAIDDAEERTERASELLDRFGGWFDITEVLALIPLDWSLDTIDGFLISAIRALIQEKNETMIAKALAGAQNLRTSASMIEKLEALQPIIVNQDIGQAVQ